MKHKVKLAIILAVALIAALRCCLGGYRGAFGRGVARFLCYLRIAFLLAIAIAVAAVAIAAVAAVSAPRFLAFVARVSALLGGLLLGCRLLVGIAATALLTVSLMVTALLAALVVIVVAALLLGRSDRRTGRCEVAGAHRNALTAALLAFALVAGRESFLFIVHIDSVHGLLPVKFNPCATLCDSRGCVTRSG